MPIYVDPSLRELIECGCGEGTSQETPVRIENRPGLSTVTYRVGTHARFMESMLARLSDKSNQKLRQLKTRDPHDPTIAFLDACAAVDDVLTFYQERYTNESYLRTATERTSLVHLARLIGYEPRPGVAASTYLAFTVEDTPGSPEKTFIEAGTRVQSIPGPNELPQSFETSQRIEARTAWNAMKVRTRGPQVPKTDMDKVIVQGIEAGVKIGDRMLIVEEKEKKCVKIVRAVIPDNANQITRIEFDGSSNTCNGTNDIEQGVFALRQRAAIFGHNAPAYDKLPTSVKNQYLSSSYWQTSNAAQNSNLVDLDNVYPAMSKNSWVVLETRETETTFVGRVIKNQEETISEYIITGRVTRLTFDKSVTFQVRKTSVYGQSEKLPLAEIPITTSNKNVSTVILDKHYPGLSIGQLVVVSGTLIQNGGIGQNGGTGVEMRRIKEVIHKTDKQFTELELDSPLDFNYEIESVVISANVAEATHGESKSEILGSGDAKTPNQTFLLRHAPLTHIGAETPTGAQSTLEVRVNDLLWQEVPNLYGRSPDERVYAIRVEDDGKTRIQFNSRIPSGQENVQARYRQGIGLAGRVKANQLSLLAVRPLGVRDVTNPLESSPGQDPENPAEIRRNASLTALTLDRLVSLRDYEDFARSFAGISKACATLTVDGERQGLFITVAGAGGTVPDEKTRTFINLVAAMKRFGDPHVSFVIKPYRQKFFQVQGQIAVDPAYSPNKVVLAIEATLHQTFSFEVREFGQLVTKSEVIKTMQSVPGVVFVDLDSLYLEGSNLSLEDRLLAAIPRSGIGSAEAEPAEILTLNPGQLQIGVVAL